MNTKREEESLSSTNINLLVRFNKTREVFLSVSRIFSIFLTTAATSASPVRVNSKERVPKVSCSIQDALYSNNPAIV